MEQRAAVTRRGRGQIIPPRRLLSLFADVSWSYCRVKTLLCLLGLGSLAAAVTVTHVLVRRGDPSVRALERTPQRRGRRPQQPSE